MVKLIYRFYETVLKDRKYQLDNLERTKIEFCDLRI